MKKILIFVVIIIAIAGVIAKFILSDYLVGKGLDSTELSASLFIIAFSLSCLIHVVFNDIKSGVVNHFYYKVSKEKHPLLYALAIIWGFGWTGLLMWLGIYYLTKVFI